VLLFLDGSGGLAVAVLALTAGVISIILLKCFFVFRENKAGEI